MTTWRASPYLDEVDQDDAGAQVCVQTLDAWARVSAAVRRCRGFGGGGRGARQGQRQISRPGQGGCGSRQCQLCVEPVQELLVFARPELHRHLPRDKGAGQPGRSGARPFRVSALNYSDGMVHVAVAGQEDGRASGVAASSGKSGPAPVKSEAAKRLREDRSSSMDGTLTPLRFKCLARTWMLFRTCQKMLNNKAHRTLSHVARPAFGPPAASCQRLWPKPMAHPRRVAKAYGPRASCVSDPRVPA